MKRLVLLLIVLLGTTGVRAQLGEAVKKIFAGDSVTTVHNTPLNRDSDSVYVANLQKSLEAARLNEANMRMEMEQMKLQMAAVDSVKYARQRQRIDSLRQFTKGIPVVADGDTLFYLFTKRGGYTSPATCANDRCCKLKNWEDVLTSARTPCRSTIRTLFPI